MDLIEPGLGLGEQVRLFYVLGRCEPSMLKYSVGPYIREVDVVHVDVLSRCESWLLT